MRIICILALLIILSKPGMAQTDFRAGYIVTLRHDTLTGIIDASPEKIRQKECAFRRTEDASLEVFMPAMIEGFGFSGAGSVVYKLSTTLRGARVCRYAVPGES